MPARVFDASRVELEAGADRRLCNVGVCCMYLQTFRAAVTLEHGDVIAVNIIL